jgi:hypothetical protein
MNHYPVHLSAAALDNTRGLFRARATTAFQANRPLAAQGRRSRPLGAPELPEPRARHTGRCLRRALELLTVTRSGDIVERGEPAAPKTISLPQPPRCAPRHCGDLSIGVALNLIKCFVDRNPC